MTVANQSTPTCMVIIRLHEITAASTAARTTGIVSDGFEVSRDTASNGVDHARLLRPNESSKHSEGEDRPSVRKPEEGRDYHPRNSVERDPVHKWS